MYEIAKRFDFSASHVLEGLPDDHPCSRLHGHNYGVEVVLGAGVLDETGFVVDYRALDPFKVWLDETVDHRHLNDVMAGWNPTAEHLAAWFLERACSILGLPQGDSRLAPQVEVQRPPHVAAVRVYETAKTSAEYRP